VVGGSSAINSHSVVYPSREYHDEWTKYGVTGWSWTDIAPYYRKFQTLSLPAQEVMDGLHLDYIDRERLPKDGPVHASYGYSPKPIQTAWVQTYEALGCAVNTDPIDGTAVGGLSIPNAINAEQRERSHAGVAYLTPALTRPNLEIVTDALVEKVVFDTSSGSDLVATGVQYLKDGQRHIARVGREVVVCAGTLKSPQILELSGLGSKSLLEQHDIPCLFDNANIGGLTLIAPSLLSFC
jgi:choline dehydrogenase-like flavoprotein